MKKVLFLLSLLMLPLISWGAIVVQTATGTTGPATPTWNVIGTYSTIPEVLPKGTQDSPIYTTSTGTSVIISSYKAVSNKTFSIPAVGKTNIGALVPAGSSGFRVRVFGDSVIFNCTSGLSTGTFSVGDEVASGSVFTWDGPGYNGDIYCAPKNGSAATGTMWAW